jgi:hypothetical protein
MFRRILLGSALALVACSSESEDSSELGDTALTPTNSATSGAPSQTASATTSASATATPSTPASAASSTAPAASTTPSQVGSGGTANTASGATTTNTTTEGGAPGDTASAASDDPAAGGATGDGIETAATEAGGAADTSSPTNTSNGADAGDTAGPVAAGDCTRETLSAFVFTYLDAVAAHDSSTLPVTDAVKYTENSHEMTLSEGLWAIGGEAGLVRSLIDTVQCSTVTEVVMPEDGVDIVMTLRLTLDGGKLSEAEAVITRDGDWLFDADGYLDSADQKWDVLPEEQRTSRADLIAAAKAYYDEFNDNPSEMGDDPIDIPFDPDDCIRLEGGAATAGCTMGIPDGVPINNRRYWADEEAGVSVAIALFADLLDVHFYRMISDTIRNVHSMSVQSESFRTTGWPEGED